MLRKTFLILVLTFGIFFPSIKLFSQVARFNHLTVDDGLTQNSISCIVQDKRGFIWIGTYEGLNKYDGYKITKYLNDPKDSTSIPGGVIRCIYPDDDNNLWFGTNGGGMCRINLLTNQITRFLLDTTSDNSIVSNSINDIKEYKKDILYIATPKGLSVFNKKTQTFSLISHSDKDPNSLLANSIKTMTKDKAGHIWFGHSGYGLTEFIPEQNKFIRHTINSPGSHLTDNKIRTLFTDSKGLVWISLWASGMNVYDPNTKLFYNSRDTSGILKNVLGVGLVSQFYEDSKANIWFCTAEKGICRYDRQTGKITFFGNNPDDPESLGDNTSLCIMEDKSGLVWAGTWKGGINYFDPRSLSFGYIKHESNLTNTLPNNNIVSFYNAGDNQVLIGTNANLCYFNTNNKTFTPFYINEKDPFSLLPNSIVLASLKDNVDGSYWIATGGGGVYRYFPKTNKYKNYSPTSDSTSLSYDTPNNIFQDKNNNIWITTVGAGINLYNREKDNFIRFTKKQKDINGLTSNYVVCVIENKEGNFLLGTEASGVLILDPEKRTFTQFADKNGLQLFPEIGVSAILIDKKGTYWIGTASGLRSVDPITKVVTDYGDIDPLLKVEFFGIVEDNTNNLWMTSSKGLYRFDVKTHQVKVFSKEDGVQGKEFNVRSMMKLPNGKIFAGGINGLNFFSPEDLRENTNPPMVAFTNFQVLNKPFALAEDISLIKEITLSYKDYFFSFNFAAMDFSNPEQNQFKYKLEGFNDDWINNGNQHNVTFTNLDPGDYVLKIKASNSSGYWNEEPTTLKITITPPFWRTKWFYALCIILGCLSIYAFIKYREKKLVAEKILLERKVEERTEELNQEKLKVEEAHKDIKDSIQYAQKIQSAIIPSNEEFIRHLPNSFVCFQPKDVVSGDFYWLTEKNDFVFCAIADCTGHGVPGGFMTMLGSGLLNEIVNEHNVTEPAEILNKLREKIINSLKQTGKSGENKDGMDIVLLRIKKDSNKLCYSAANNGFIIVNKSGMTSYNGDKQPVGIYGDVLKPFTQHDVEIVAGDMLYSYTDGYPDQFGGPKGKKFKYKQLNELLIQISKSELGEQKNALEKSLQEWKGEIEQVDDVCVIGIKF